MQLESKYVDGIFVLTLMDKRLDARLAVDFRAKMSEIINEGNRAIVINLGEVDFIDSSGLGAIVTCLKLMGPSGRLALCGLSAPVNSMFTLTRMDRVFTLCGTEDVALQTLKA